MGLIVSTTGNSVTLPELGITLTHPTTDRDLSGQFSPDEIGRCDSLTTAIRSGALSWKKALAGMIQPPTDYDPDFLDIEAENTGMGLSDDRVVTFKDLRAAITAFTGTAPTLASYTGNASAGRYLEIFPGTDSLTVPFLIPVPSKLIAFSLQASATATVTIGVFKTTNLVTPIATISLTAQLYNSDITLSAPIAAGERLAVRVVSGSCNRPSVALYITAGGV